MDYILAKVFNNDSYAASFLAGKLYINPLASFGIGNLYNPREDMSNKYRGDMNEGLRFIAPLNAIMSSDPAYAFYKNMGVVPRKDITIGELDSRFLNEHIMSFYYIFKLVISSLCGDSLKLR